MAKKPSSVTLTPPQRVQIMKVDSTGYWKVGQFGYAIVRSTHAGMHTLDNGPSKPGETSYLVSKSKGMRGGALWFSPAALRFTGRK